MSGEASAASGSGSDHGAGASVAPPITKSIKAQRLLEVHAKALQKAMKVVSKPELVLQSFQMEASDARAKRLLELQSSLVKTVTDHALEDIRNINDDYDIGTRLDEIDVLEARDKTDPASSADRQRRHLEQLPKTPEERIMQKKAVNNKLIRKRCADVLQRLNEENEALSESLIQQRKEVQDALNLVSVFGSKATATVAASQRKDGSLVG